MIRYHMTVLSTKYVYAVHEGQNSYLDRLIAATLAGLEPDRRLKECTKPKCDICAERGWSLYTDFKKGEYILETQGQYSDYGVGKLLLVLKSFNRSTVKDVDEAISKGYVQAIEHKEWWFD